MVIVVILDFAISVVECGKKTCLATKLMLAPPSPMKFSLFITNICVHNENIINHYSIKTDTEMNKFSSLITDVQVDLSHRISIFESGSKINRSTRRLADGCRCVMLL